MPDYTPYPVELITPEGAAYADDAQMVIVPGAAGQLGILANHAPLVSLVDAGEVRITDAGGELHRFATSSGFLQVRGNKALLLVGEALSSDADRRGRGPLRGSRRPRLRWTRPVRTTSIRRAASWPTPKPWSQPASSRATSSAALTGFAGPPAIRSATSWPSANPGTLPTPL